jgi:hypothetical protein
MKWEDKYILVPYIGKYTTLPPTVSRIFYKDFLVNWATCLIVSHLKESQVANMDVSL